MNAYWLIPLAVTVALVWLVWWKLGKAKPPQFVANAQLSPIDERDYYFYPIISEFPAKLDLIPDVIAVEDQGAQGSCVANGVVSMCEVMLKRAGEGRHLSREFLYHEALKMEGRLGQEGLYPRDAFKVGRSLGIPDESVYPYDITKRDIDPPADVYAAAVEQRINRYESMHFSPWGDAANKLTMIKAALCEGLPVGFAMPVTNSYTQMRGDWRYQWYLPYGKEPSIGGHWQVFIGYDDAVQKLCVMNSWGQSWGDLGFGGIPYRDLENVNEAWVIRKFDDCGLLRAPGIYCTRNDQTGLSAQIVPTPEENGTTVNVWLGGMLGGVMYLKTPTGAWTPFDGTLIPSWSEVRLDGALDINIADGNFSALKGVDVYVAYGQTPLVWKAAKICTI